MNRINRDVLHKIFDRLSLNELEGISKIDNKWREKVEKYLLHGKNIFELCRADDFFTICLECNIIPNDIRFCKICRIPIYVDIAATNNIYCNDFDCYAYICPKCFNRPIETCGVCEKIVFYCSKNCTKDNISDDECANCGRIICIDCWNDKDERICGDCA